MATSTNEITNFAGQVQGSLTSAGEVHSLNLDFTENAGQATGSVEGVTQDLSNADLTSNIANFTGKVQGTITTLGNVHTLNCNIDFGDLSQMGIYNFSLDLSKYLEQQVVEKDYYAVATLLGNGPVLDTNPVMQASTSVLVFDIKTFGGANTTAKINLEMTFATNEQGEGGGTTDPSEPEVPDNDPWPDVKSGTTLSLKGNLPFGAGGTTEFPVYEKNFDLPAWAVPQYPSVSNDGNWYKLTLTKVQANVWDLESQFSLRRIGSPTDQSLRFHFSYCIPFEMEKDISENDPNNDKMHYIIENSGSYGTRIRHYYDYNPFKADTYVHLQPILKVRLHGNPLKECKYSKYTVGWNGLA